MKSINELQVDNWVSLDLEKKKEWLKSFEGYRGHAFTLKNVEIGIFELDGCEYVFVPGSKVRLGWNQVVEQDEFIRAALQIELEIAGFEQDVLDYLSTVFSPVREAESAASNADGRLVNYREIIKEFNQQGFSLLTEDEWEYVCGGGTKRIFNEQLDPCLLEDICKQRRYYTNANLEKPNSFGLYIAYDPYMYELVNSRCYAKGGDGGAATHGGYYKNGIAPMLSGVKCKSTRRNI
ncbi:hypothetical protein [Brevibacillus sp. 179-C9.3 HS]|uniref:hypothetical protein n=1 Tax=unclassified Brevibacillus TaxID=2684853 RepID=UPI0039A1697B